MSDEKKNTPDASTPSKGNKIAEAYIKDQLELARKNLSSTRFVMGLLVVFVVGYMTVITVKLTENFAPKAASEVVLGTAGTYATQYTDQMLDEVSPKLVGLLAPYPDRILAEFPVIRKDLEDGLVDAIREHAVESSDQLGYEIDIFLAEHKDEVAELLKAADDPAAIDELGEDMYKMMVEYLKLPISGNESMLQKIDTSRIALQQIRDHVTRLAFSYDLTDHEKKQRRIIAIVARTAARDDF